MIRPAFTSVLSLAFGLAMAIMACAARADAPAMAAGDEGKAEAYERPRPDERSTSTTIRVGRGSPQTLLIGMPDRSILQVEPRSGRVVATVAVPVLPSRIVADATNIYFGGRPMRYDLSTHEVVDIATSDSFTEAVAMAISPRGTFFASNSLYFRADIRSCGPCSTAVAYLDPDVLSQETRIYFFYGNVRPVVGGDGLLIGQQIGFTDDARLLVTSRAGDGIFLSNEPMSEVCCDSHYMNFRPLVADATDTTLRFARLGDQRLLVLHSDGRLDEHDLTTGHLVRPVFQAGTLDPVDMVVGHDNTLYVLEHSGQVRVFSELGREMGRITLPAAAGRAVSLALCCGTPPHGRHRR